MSICVYSVNQVWEMAVVLNPSVRVVSLGSWAAVSTALSLSDTASEHTFNTMHELTAQLQCMLSHLTLYTLPTVGDSLAGCHWPKAHGPVAPCLLGLC